MADEAAGRQARSARPGAASAPERAPDDVVLRRVETADEYAECVQLQMQTWGADFKERVPATVLRVAQYVGGVTAGAFAAEGRLLGFVFGMTGVRDGRLVHWSDLLAVRPDARDRGIGARLKRYQRDLLRPIGVETMYWTFDPLVSRNAHLNLNRLGARVAEYVRDMYGPDTGSALPAAPGTDRFIVRWDLTAGAAAPADDRLGTAGPGDASAPVVNEPQDGDGVPVVRELVDAPAVRVEVPHDITRVAGVPDVARRWRETTRRAFLSYLGRGYQVVAFRHDATAGRAFYHLARP